MVAKELNRLPLRVMWIDQEVEWQGTVDYVESIMTRQDVKPMWFQMPMVITNNASSFNRYNYCWRQSDKNKWLHPKHPLSIKVNKYNTERFHELFKAIIDTEFPDRKACYIAGVRTEESPNRYIGLTYYICYKWITWGKKLNTDLGHYTFYPIYDWKIQDIWKAIYDNLWPYNRIYDRYFQYGHPIQKMRISNLHHETAIQNLLLVQQIEPDTWSKVTKRIDGANTIKQLKKRAFACPVDLPFMFDSWADYAEHLIANIVQEEKNRKRLRKYISKWHKVFIHEKAKRDFFKVIINTILSSDWDYTKLDNFLKRPVTIGYRRWLKGRPFHHKWINNKYIPAEDRLKIQQKLKGSTIE
jgi:predicted phosphoadenosine phosphosulfate sulfurtransferase